VGREYPDVERDHAFIDAACMWMVKNPEWFYVAVTGNMMGDIITDLGAAISGGLGIAASGNLHPGKVSMFEPIHGSAPKHAEGRHLPGGAPATQCAQPGARKGARWTHPKSLASGRSIRARSRMTPAPMDVILVLSSDAGFARPDRAAFGSRPVQLNDV
jgi:hypothetical protein